MAHYRYTIRIDGLRNVMYIDQKGQPTATDFQNLKRQFLIDVANMRPGFAIINDQRELEPFDDEAMKVAKELVEITNQHRASRVIRILPQDLLSKVKLSTTLSTAKNRYANIRVASPEEAEAALEAPLEDLQA